MLNEFAMLCDGPIYDAKHCVGDVYIGMHLFIYICIFMFGDNFPGVF